MPENDVEFVKWLSAVDGILKRNVGLGHDDLPDCCYRDWFDDGISPRDAATMALEEAGFQD